MVSSQQKVGFWPITAIAIGNILGSGAFTLPASLAIYGNIALFGWIITVDHTSLSARLLTRNMAFTSAIAIG
jgi:APA family basic amino acid/polyamine antiporter